MKTYAELCEAAAEQSGFGIGPQYDKFLIRLVMEECAQIADAESSCEGIAQRIASAIRAAAKDLK